MRIREISTNTDVLLIHADFSADSSRLYTAGWDRGVQSVFTWDIENQSFCTAKARKFYSMLTSAPDGFLTVMEKDGTVSLLWPNSLRKYLSLGECYKFGNIAYTSDACYLASIRPNGHPCFWDLENGEIFAELEEWEFEHCATFVHVLENENQVAIGHSFGYAIWDAEINEITATRKFEDDGLYEYAISPDKQRMACVSDECHLRVFETETWTEVMSVFVKSRPGFCGIQFAPDSKSLLICGETKVAFVDIDSGDLQGVHRKPRDWELRGAAVSPCNDLFACVWQTPGMRSCIETMNISSFLI